MRRYSLPLVPETFQARFPVSSVVCRRSVDLWPTPKYHAAREKKTLVPRVVYVNVLRILVT